MPRRISRLGGTTLRRSFMTKAYSPAIFHGGPRNGPQPPHRSDRPGKAVAVLYLKLTSGCSEQAAVLRHHAAILDHTDPPASERLPRGVGCDAQPGPHHRPLPRDPPAPPRAAMIPPPHAPARQRRTPSTEASSSTVRGAASAI